jgi:hypothetical protein
MHHPHPPSSRRKPVSLFAILRALLVAVLLPVLSGPALAADAAAGKVLYESGNASVRTCTGSGCHLSLPARGATTVAGISNLISFYIANQAGMNLAYSGKLSSSQIDNIAAYLLNPNAAPVAAASPLTLGFTSATVGSTSAQTLAVSLSNSGNAPLLISTIGLSGTQAGSFAINTAASSCANGLSIAAAASCQVNLGFKPTLVGNNLATLTIVHNAGTSTVALSGTGNAVPVPTLSLSAASLDLGSATVGTNATAKTLTVTNSGQAALNLSSIALSGTNAAAFSTSGGCSTATALAAGTSCTLNLSFSPTSVGAQSASLVLQSNASNGAQTVSLAGNGTAVPAPIASRSPATLGFGNVTINTAAVTQLVTVTNSGDAAMAIGALTISGSSAFSVSAAGTTCASTLAAGGASCNIVVAYSPTQAVADSANLNISSNASASALVVALSGSGVVPLVAVPSLSDNSAIIFVDTETGKSSAAHTTTLSNTGNVAFTIATLAISGNHAVDFPLGGTCVVTLSVAAGGSCTVITRFAPVEPGAPLVATLNLSTSNGTAFSLNLSGNAISVGGPALSLSLATLDFGSISVGQVSAVQRLSLTNTGTQETTISLPAALANGFALQSPMAAGDCPAFPLTLLPQQSCTLAIAFNATSVGAASATLSLLGDKAGSPAAVSTQLNLSATAIAAAIVAAAASTATSGGGCTATTDGHDLSLMLLVGAALWVGVWRRSQRRAARRASSSSPDRI